MQHLYYPQVTFKNAQILLLTYETPPTHLPSTPNFNKGVNVRTHKHTYTHTHTCTYIPKQLRHYKTLLNSTLEVKCHMCQYKTDVLQLPLGSNFICDTTLSPLHFPKAPPPPQSPATSASHLALTTSAPLKSHH